MSRVTILQGDCLEVLKTLTNESVQCVVTSPPYWGLRDYGVDGQIGLERTPEEYVAKMVGVFREVRRVLREDGTCWLNLGDCYMGGGRGGGAENCKQRTNVGSLDASPNQRHDSIKTKDLVGIPWRVAFALQADGWYLRSDIIWHKPNPMPESVTDRPTKAHEYLFLLTKAERYFYDAEAIKEPVTGGAHPRANGQHSRMVLERAAGKEKSKPNPSRSHVPGVTPKSAEKGSGIKSNESFHAACTELVSSRNRRSVWTIATAPYAEAHFATFPPDLVKPCIMAGTSSAGCCAECGAPFERVIEKGAPDEAHKKACGADSNGEYNGKSTKDYGAAKAQDASAVKARILEGMRERKTVGWRQQCACKSGIKPCVVLDPFGGSGTTGAVALELGRHAILIELNPDYAKLAEDRCNITPGLALA